MALLWEALATRDVRLLTASMQRRFRIDPSCAWVDYVRSHDDIGWTFDDAGAARLGINGFDHRQFLNAFYTGRFPGSFARGLPFQENPRTGDARISGTAASLAGLEKALRDEGDAEIDFAIRRLLILYGIVLSVGGIPLIYLGDEVGTRNDYAYGADPAKAADSRWVHRPAADWSRIGRRSDSDSIEARAFSGLRHLIRLRRGCPAFAGADTDFVDTGNTHVFGYLRRGGGERVVVLGNFTERPQTVAANLIRLHGLAYAFTDLISDEAVDLDHDLELAPYRLAWLVPR